MLWAQDCLTFSIMKIESEWRGRLENMVVID